ncbi:hypothetical protein [Ferruginibacter sp. HRS2-29]|uniref:hypothetical protein n=1 Tax=Ferruginibacter sp. HRS2-29 TaxID=2487334 RepID=UPI0020CF2B5F|nr:hypothetical protein [Ferruginibacter sp. HRS2-29]MCP9751997.1 hypothetical protein [Ferruginibacter sp. HRS2-29]
MLFKEKVHAAFLQLQSKKIAELKKVIADLSYSAANETKSTAGDKHETALAHLQTSISQAYQQLQELNNQYNLLTSLHPSSTHLQIAHGSIVTTNRNIFYISAAIGKLNIDGKTVYAMSPSSPLALKMMGKKETVSIEMNGIIHLISEVS